jgi:hypothetical protein
LSSSTSTSWQLLAAHGRDVAVRAYLGGLVL